MQRNFSVPDAVAKLFDQKLEKLGFIYENTQGRKRYALGKFITAIALGEVIVYHSQGNAIVFVEIPHKKLPLQRQNKKRDIHSDDRL